MDVVIDTIWRVAVDFWRTVGEMSPYLLLGFALAGLLSVLISARWVERHLGGGGLWPVLKASAFGIPLPLCSCGVIPVGASLHRQGASRGATTAFLISTPQTGVDSIMVTFSLLGLTFAIYRPLAALVSGVLGGSLVAYTARPGKNDPDAKADPPAGGSCQSGGKGCCGPADEVPHGLYHLAKSIITYGFVTLPQDIGRSMLIGLAIAAIITAVVPSDFFTGVLSGGIVAMLAMIALGIPVYVCATASVPVAAALIAKGVSPGVALVFLMTGPATNAATIATIWRTMGSRTAVLYLTSVATAALASGLLLDWMFPNLTVQIQHAAGWMLPVGIRTVLAIILLAVLGFGAIRSYLPARKHLISPKDMLIMENEPTIRLKVEGMSCNHCKAAVERALTDVPGVESVEVQLKPGGAVVAGQAGADKLIKAVESVGYTAEVIEDKDDSQG